MDQILTLFIFAPLIVLIWAAVIYLLIMMWKDLFR